MLSLRHRQGQADDYAGGGCRFVGAAKGRSALLLERRALIRNFVKGIEVVGNEAEGFKNPWRARLGLNYHESIRNEHWGRVKALCRRIANRWGDEYDGLRPVADFVRQLQASISLWLDSPSEWTRVPENEDARQAAIDEIRRKVFNRIHELSKQRLITSHSMEWLTAFAYSGTGSSRDRARELSGIYDEAAPSVTSVSEQTAQEFLNQVIQIVSDAVEEAGGSVIGAQTNDAA